MLYIQDRQNKTLGVVSDYYNDTHQMILSSGLSSYTFTIAKNIKDVEHLIEGNYVVVTDDSGIGWKFTIMNISQTHSEITLYCEDIGLELINKVMDSWVAPSTKQPASYYINKAIKDTQWEIGINEISNLSRTLKWEGRDTSLNRLLSICTEFDHAEIEFRVRFKNLQVTDYIIDIYKKRGADRSDIQLVYGDTVNDITKTSSIEGLATALMGVGSDKELPENSPAETVADKTTFKDLTYDDGLLFTKAGDKFLRARVANQQFNLKEGYIEDFYEYDTADPQELLNRTITQLKERSEIKVNYEVSVAKFEKTLQLGDTITIIDHDYKPELLLSGRVLEMDKSYTDPSKNTLVLGNFLILYSNTNDRLTNLQNQIKNMKIVNNYMWLRYAIDDKGNGMSATPTDGTKYFAMLVNKKTGIPSDNPADYAGHWKLIQGADGKDGIPGATGADGKTSYTHFAYANDVSGHSDFSLDDPTDRSYMGVYSDFTKPDSTNPDDYVWSLTKGETGAQGLQGLQGATGNQGIQGPKGPDGKSSYTHIAYGTSNSGAGFTQTPSTSTTYIGMYVDQTATDNNDPKKYAWSLIKGADGANGTPGAKGADGKTPYFHQAWADSKDGKVNFSTTDPTNRGYLGTYSDFTQADSNDPSKYFWTELVGALVIGGRNYLLDTNTPWQMQGSGGAQNSSMKWLFTFGTIKQAPFNDGDYVTLSFDYINVGSGAYGTIFAQLNNTPWTEFGVRVAMKDNGHVVRTVQWKSDWTTSGTATGILIRMDNVATTRTVTVYNMQFERGNKATDHKVAPEDTQGQIDSVNQGLADTNKLIAETPVPYLGSTAPNNPKKDDQWWVKDSSNEVTAFKQWDGSKWVDSMIQQSLLNIVTLNSVTLNSAVINSPDINVPFTNLALPGFPQKMTGVMTVKDAKYSIDGKYGTGGSVFHTGLTPDGWESYQTTTDGSTKLNYARVSFGELQLWTYLSGSGSNAKYAQGSLSGQDTIRNSVATPTYYTNGWAPWTTYWPFLLKRNGRQITISGYLKNTGSSSSDFSIGASILKLPDWGEPFTPAIIPGTRQNAVTGSTGDASVVLGLDTSGILHIESSGFKVGQWLSFSASYFGKDLS